MERSIPDRAWSWFSKLVACDTSAPAGEIHLGVDDPRVERFAHEVAAPILRDLGAKVDVDRVNNVIATFGPMTGRELLLLLYPATHHGNEMERPFEARSNDIDGERVWLGLGASEGKGPMAAVLTALSIVLEAGVDLQGRVVIAVSSEGSSTHESARHIFRYLDPSPSGALLAIGTGNRLVLGNRGRVDIEVEIEGSPTHSSDPSVGVNPIPQVGPVLEAIASLALDQEEHPLLGRRSLLPYQLTCGPIAPHTIPRWCRLLLDMRTLPGDTVAGSVDAVADRLRGSGAHVRPGSWMLPYCLDEQAVLVQTIQAAAEDSLGRRLEIEYPAWTYDAGYAASLGIETVQFGPSSTRVTGAGVLGTDHVPQREIEIAVDVYRAALTMIARR